jgi:DJ-1 family protein
MASVLIILADGAEEIETLAAADVLVRGGHQVTVASASATTVVEGSRGLPLAAHTRLAEVADRSFDVLYLPGGKRCAEICRDDARIQDLAERQLRQQRILATICSAALALVPRQLCAGRRITSFPAVRPLVEPHCAAWLDQAVVDDGTLITSQGAGTTIDLGLALVARLSDAATADGVARQMLYRRAG